MSNENESIRAGSKWREKYNREAARRIVRVTGLGMIGELGERVSFSFADNEQRLSFFDRATFLERFEPAPWEEGDVVRLEGDSEEWLLFRRRETADQAVLGGLAWLSDEQLKRATFITHRPKAKREEPKPAPEFASDAIVLGAIFVETGSELVPKVDPKLRRPLRWRVVSHDEHFVGLEGFCGDGKLNRLEIRILRSMLRASCAPWGSVKANEAIAKAREEEEEARDWRAPLVFDEPVRTSAEVTATLERLRARAAGLHDPKTGEAIPCVRRNGRPDDAKPPPTPRCGQRWEIERAHGVWKVGQIVHVLDGSANLVVRIDGARTVMTGALLRSIAKFLDGPTAPETPTEALSRVVKLEAELPPDGVSPEAWLVHLLACAELVPNLEGIAPPIDAVIDHVRATAALAREKPTPLAVLPMQRRQRFGWVDSEFPTEEERAQLERDEDGKHRLAVKAWDMCIGLAKRSHVIDDLLAVERAEKPLIRLALAATQRAALIRQAARLAEKFRTAIADATGGSK